MSASQWTDVWLSFIQTDFSMWKKNTLQTDSTFYWKILICFKHKVTWDKNAVTKTELLVYKWYTLHCFLYIVFHKINIWIHFHVVIMCLLRIEHHTFSVTFYKVMLVGAQNWQKDKLQSKKCSTDSIVSQMRLVLGQCFNSIHSSPSTDQRPETQPSQSLTKLEPVHHCLFQLTAISQTPISP